jgi:ribosomal protein L12E/L44/L45/RPP1/RPP2
VPGGERKAKHRWEETPSAILSSIPSVEEMTSSSAKKEEEEEEEEEQQKEEQEEEQEGGGGRSRRITGRTCTQSER